MSFNLVTPIIEKKVLNKDMFIITVNCTEKPLAGQFVMIRSVSKFFEPYLSRPISVYDWKDGRLYMLIKIVGKGTELISNLSIGNIIRVTGFFGTNYPINGKKLLLIGGGIGIAPLYYAAKEAKTEKTEFILGFRSKDDVILKEEFSAIGTLNITTDDGTAYFKGNPVNYLNENLKEIDNETVILSCGPKIMMRGIEKALKEREIKHYCSLDTAMGCGMGACLGCRIEVDGNSKLICKDGPVFDAETLFNERRK